MRVFDDSYYLEPNCHLTRFDVVIMARYILPGDVWVQLFDDFALRHRRLSFLVKNKIGATLTWLGVFVGYTWLLAGAVEIFSDGMLPLEDALWFSYITLTTVGFGDISISNDAVTISDIFFLPPIMLLGFSFLRNFLLKLSELIIYYFPEDEFTLERRLRDLREGQKHQSDKVEGCEEDDHDEASCTHVQEFSSDGLDVCIGPRM